MTSLVESRSLINTFHSIAALVSPRPVRCGREIDLINTQYSGPAANSCEYYRASLEIVAPTHVSRPDISRTHHHTLTITRGRSGLQSSATTALTSHHHLNTVFSDWTPFTKMHVFLQWSSVWRIRIVAFSCDLLVIASI